MGNLLRHGVHDGLRGHDGACNCSFGVDGLAGRIPTSGGVDSFADNVRGGSINLRKVAQDLSPEEFFSLFKRFSLTLSSGGILEGHEYSYTE